MPAPDNLSAQTPGDPLATMTPLASASAEAIEPVPVFSAKHNGGGRWKIWSTADDDWFSDYLAAGDGAKVQAEAEAERLNGGGEPFVKLVEQPQVSEVKAPKSAASTGAINPATLKQAVMTPDGWLCPEPLVKE